MGVVTIYNLVIKIIHKNKKAARNCSKSSAKNTEIKRQYVTET